MIPTLKTGTGCEWKDRLTAETIEIAERLEKLNSAFNDKDFKVSSREWELLTLQRSIMREYVDCLVQRCYFYDLVEGEGVCLNGSSKIGY